MSSPLWVEQCNIDNAYTKSSYSFAMDLSNPHLILTGKNGSGKTTCLKQMLLELVKSIHSDPLGKNIKYYNAQAQNRAQTSILKFDCQRNMKFTPVEGPTSQATPEHGGQLHQILVNLRTQQAYAREEQDAAAAQALEEKIRTIENKFKILFEDEQLELVFHRDKIKYTLRTQQQDMEFDALPDGFNSLLHIWSSLWAEEEKLKQKTDDYYMFAFVDEIETHLHVSLQKRVLYFLTQFFPRVQFFVTTHSPLVLSSVDNAVIYDLSDHKRYLSKDLMGLNYGHLMMSHFGLTTDFDLQTTAELAELKALHRDPQRTEAQTARMRALAQKLAEKSHLLALHIWEELSEVP